MTTARRDGNDSPFSDWTRGESRLDSIAERIGITDCDYWIHQYRSRLDKIGDRAIDSIMLVELKTFSADLHFSQRDTLQLVGEGLRLAFRNTRGNVRTIPMKIGHETRCVRFYGAFLLQLSSDRPDTSEEIFWHRKKIDIATLIDVLAFKRDPRTFRIRNDRRHHSLSVQNTCFDFGKIE